MISTLKRLRNFLNQVLFMAEYNLEASHRTAASGPGFTRPMPSGFLRAPECKTVRTPSAGSEILSVAAHFSEVSVIGASHQDSAFTGCPHYCMPLPLTRVCGAVFTRWYAYPRLPIPVNCLRKCVLEPGQMIWPLGEAMFRP